MGKWNIQQEMKLENRERRKVRRENLNKFFYDLAKLVFAGVVIGGIPSIYKDALDFKSFTMIITGMFTTCMFALWANKLLK